MGRLISLVKTLKVQLLVNQGRVALGVGQFAWAVSPARLVLVQEVGTTIPLQIRLGQVATDR